MYPEDDEEEDQQANYEYEQAPKKRRRGRPIFDGDAVAMKVQGLPRPVLLVGFVGFVALIGFIAFTGTKSADESDALEPVSETTSITTDNATEPATPSPTAAATPDEVPPTNPTNVPAVEPVVEPEQELLPLPASSIKAGMEVVATGLTALTTPSWAEQSTLFSPEVLASFTGPAEAYVPVSGEVKMGRVRMLLADAVSVEATIGDVAYLVTVIKANGTWLIQGIDLLNDSAISAGE